MLKKKKIPNAVKRKLGIIVYDGNVNFVREKKTTSVLPDASGLACLIHLLSRQLRALGQTPHLLHVLSLSVGTQSVPAAGPKLQANKIAGATHEQDP